MVSAVVVELRVGVQDATEAREDVSNEAVDLALVEVHDHFTVFVPNFAFAQMLFAAHGSSCLR
jgi:hypothetical protein